MATRIPKADKKKKSEPWDDHPALILDTGCHAAPSCLACPLPNCALDQPVSVDLPRKAA